MDLAAGVLTIERLKKRRTGICRTVPMPSALLDALDPVHGTRELQARQGPQRTSLVLDRMTGWRAVHAILAVHAIPLEYLHTL